MNINKNYLLTVTPSSSVNPIEMAFNTTNLYTTFYNIRCVFVGSYTLGYDKNADENITNMPYDTAKLAKSYEGYTASTECDTDDPTSTCKFTLSSNYLSGKTGYDFMGWSYDKDLDFDAISDDQIKMSGSECKDGDLCKPGSWTTLNYKNPVRTLYAIWKAY